MNARIAGGFSGPTGRGQVAGGNKAFNGIKGYLRTGRNLLDELHRTGDAAVIATVDAYPPGSGVVILAQRSPVASLDDVIFLHD